MSENILEKIIKKKSEKIDNLKKTLELSSLQDLIDKNNSFNDSKEIVFFKFTIFSLFFSIIFSRTFSAILNFF